VNADYHFGEEHFEWMQGKEKTKARSFRFGLVKTKP
jgi:hypothetical protein